MRYHSWLAPLSSTLEDGRGWGYRREFWIKKCCGYEAFQRFASANGYRVIQSESGLIYVFNINRADVRRTFGIT